MNKLKIKLMLKTLLNKPLIKSEIHWLMRN